MILSLFQKTQVLILFVFVLLHPEKIHAQISSGTYHYLNTEVEVLRTKIEKILKSYHANGGISIEYNGTADTLNIHGDIVYPMQSVYKFHLALAILDAVDKNILKLDQQIKLTKKDLLEDTWSPMRDDHPVNDLSLSISDLLMYSVSKSDNNACDVLFRIIGGPEKVNIYLYNLGFKDIHIVADENAMHKDHKLQYKNSTTPKETNKLLIQFTQGKILSEKSTAFLMKLMYESSNSKKRIRGLLPDSIPVAHKTGTSATNKKGIRGACNDIGMIDMPGGNELYLCMFIRDTKIDLDTCELMMAKIADVAYRHFLRFENGRNINVTNSNWVDQSRKRNVPLSIYNYNDKRFRNNKLVIISGEYGISHGDYSFIANRLAGIGYTVISIAHDLEMDEQLPNEGDLFNQRMPFWIRGTETIAFVIRKIKLEYPELDEKNVILIGHSNGGDISALFAGTRPENIDKLITLDNLRMPLPHFSKPKILSIRAADTKADMGVIPEQETQSKFGIQIIYPVRFILHNEMCDKGHTQDQRELIWHILRFIQA